jgi:hypothetical protein
LLTLHRRDLLVAGLLLVVGCRATPPPRGDGPGVSPNTGPYPSLANCSPAPDCPGPSCASNATGQADGTTVDLAQCRALQLTFTNGTIVPRYDQPDLAVEVGQVQGLTRVEASADALEFEVVGFINGGPRLECQAEQQNNRFLIYLERCNAITDVYVVRLVRDESVQGGLTVDAVEALSFKPIGQP